MSSLTVQPKLPLSIQLYSLRSILGEDFKGTLQGLAQIGFEAVELAGIYGGMEPDALAAFLAATGLRATGLHAMPGGLAQLQASDSVTFRYAKALQCEFVSLSLRPEVDTLQQTIADLKQATLAAADQGLILTYHNHDHEFAPVSDGRPMLEVLLEETADVNMQFQFDVFFAQHRDYDPCKGLERFKGRVPQIHFNDLDPEGRNACDAASGCMKLSTELGAGCLDLQAIYRKAVETGVRLVVLEQHSSRRHPLESARINYDYYHHKLIA